MKIFKNIIQVSAYLCLIYFIVTNISSILKDIVNKIIPLLNFISYISLATLLIIAYLRKRIISKLSNIFLGSELKDGAYQFYIELPNPSKKSTANLFSLILYRLTRIGMWGILVTLIPIILIAQQNLLFRNQNKLFEIQNSKIDIQTNLLEANRRSSLVFMFNNILDAIDTELKEDLGEANKRDLSMELQARIISLSNKLLPYSKYDNNSLSVSPLSPERGMLLHNLVLSDIDTATLFNIFRNANFTYSDIRDARFESKFIKHLDLSNSNLNKVVFSHSVIENVDFSNIDLSETKFASCNIHKVRFDDSIELKANFYNCQFVLNHLGNITDHNFNNFKKNQYALCSYNFFKPILEDNELTIDTVRKYVFDNSIAPCWGNGCYDEENTYFEDLYTYLITPSKSFELKKSVLKDWNVDSTSLNNIPENHRRLKHYDAIPNK